MTTYDSVWTTGVDRKTQSLENMLHIFETLKITKSQCAAKHETMAKSNPVVDLVELVEKTDKKLGIFLQTKTMEYKQIERAKFDFISDFVESINAKGTHLSQIVHNFDLIENRIRQLNTDKNKNFIRLDCKYHEYAMHCLDRMQTELNEFDSSYDNLEKIVQLRDKYFANLFDNNLNFSLKLEDWLRFVDATIQFHNNLKNNHS
jgi:hypothetical protein